MAKKIGHTAVFQGREYETTVPDPASPVTKPEEQKITCRLCRGQGSVPSYLDGRIVDCPYCNGDGTSPPQGRPPVCKAARSRSDPPQDCGWPRCGCDPYAQRVLDALAEEDAGRPPAPVFAEANPGSRSGVFEMVSGVLHEVDHPHAGKWLAVLDHPPTDQCPDPECMVCAVRDCPDHEPLHYHHDGCPCCAGRPPAQKREMVAANEIAAAIACLSSALRQIAPSPPGARNTPPAQGREVEQCGPDQSITALAENALSPRPEPSSTEEG